MNKPRKYLTNNLFNLPKAINFGLINKIHDEKSIYYYNIFISNSR